MGEGVERVRRQLLWRLAHPKTRAKYGRPITVLVDQIATLAILRQLERTDG